MPTDFGVDNSKHFSRLERGQQTDSQTDRHTNRETELITLPTPRLYTACVGNCT